MAQVQPKIYFNYQSLVIHKTKRLGQGAYGAVYIALCDQLPCAAKILHPTVLDPLDPGSSKIFERFQLECSLMSEIRHPNIVQFIGVDRDHESGCPVLLMELLDESLTSFLEKSNQPLSHHLEVDISHDIALAVTYLHRNGIIHRDLSSNNVLILAGKRAKVTDFGMSRLTDSSPQMTPLTMCPGTQAYMPPEALAEPPKYSEKIDCFAEGVLLIQICTRKWPTPGPRTNVIPYENSPTGNIEVPVLETERRKSHIDIIEPNHPLLVIATPCLEYDPANRPTSSEICQRIGELKETERYRSAHQSKESQNKIDTLQKQLREKDAVIQKFSEKEKKQQKDSAQDSPDTQTKLDALQSQLREKEATIQMLRDKEKTQSSIDMKIKLESLESQLREKDARLQEKEKSQKSQKSQSLHSKEELIHTLNKSLQSLKAELAKATKQLEAQGLTTTDIDILTEALRTQLDRLTLQIQKFAAGQEVGTLTRSQVEPQHLLTLKHIKSIKSPESMTAMVCTTLEDTVYCKNRGNLYTYKPAKDHWTVYKDCALLVSPMVVVNGQLTVIGGKTVLDKYSSNKIVSLVRGKQTKWTEKLPPLPNARSHAFAVCTKDHLIVLGGTVRTLYVNLMCGGVSSDQTRHSLDIVEVLDLKSNKWSRVADMPTVRSCASADICRGKLYVLGGFDHNGKTKSVFMCSLEKLVHSSQRSSHNETTWQTVAEVPHYHSTCVVIKDQLLAIGGHDSTLSLFTCSPDVYQYSELTNAWLKIYELKLARSGCEAVEMPGSQLMVLGGLCDDNQETDCVEIYDY